MTNFTKGPWDLIDSENYTVIFGRGYEKPIGTLDSYSKGFGPNKDERLHNAYLISSAPDLYEALMEIIGDVEFGCSRESYLKARLAIKKANGEML